MRALLTIATQQLRLMETSTHSSLVRLLTWSHLLIKMARKTILSHEQKSLLGNSNANDLMASPGNPLPTAIKNQLTIIPYTSWHIFSFQIPILWVLCTLLYRLLLYVMISSKQFPFSGNSRELNHISSQGHTQHLYSSVLSHYLHRLKKAQMLG